MSRQRRN